MNIYIIILIVVAVGAIAQFSRKNALRGKPKYRYGNKKYFMSSNEHKFFDALLVAVRGQYHIFPQVHLPTILDYKIVGQNWRGAFRHIDEKSVDFVLCDKANISPILVIELDDSSHQRQDRQLRDRAVEEMLGEAGLPLIRYSTLPQYRPEDIAQAIQGTLFPSAARTNSGNLFRV